MTIHIWKSGKDPRTKSTPCTTMYDVVYSGITCCLKIHFFQFHDILVYMVYHELYPTKVKELSNLKKSSFTFSNLTVTEIL